MGKLMRLLRGRPSTTQNTAALWAKSLLSAVFFFGVFMAALPWAAHQLLPAMLPIPPAMGSWGGTILFTVGLALWVACLDAFSRRGRGTPNPGDAPQHLVKSGLHGVIRNPMIAAEMMVIWGEAFYFGSAGIVGYAVLVTLGAHSVVVWVEEPELRDRFGESYEVYTREVARWLPMPRGAKPERRRSS